jgi:hypothetical protein
MSEASIKRKNSLIALDVAMLLLGMLVMVLVLKLMRFDHPDPRYNAWTYLLGVPSILIAISMLTRVITNDFVEKSIQLGFLISVGLHLFFTVAAINVILFPETWPNNARQVALVATSNSPKPPQFYEPRDIKLQERPDYLKPAPTVPAQADPSIQPEHQEQTSSQLDIEAAKDTLTANVVEKVFNKRRREAAPSQPSIESTSERLDRPDLAKRMEQPSNPIEMPDLSPASPSPMAGLQAAPTETQRSDVNGVRSPLLQPVLQADLSPDPVTITSASNPALNKPVGQDVQQLDSEVERSLNKAANLPDRPSPIPQRKRVEALAPSEVPIPKLGAPAPNAPMDRLLDRTTQLQNKSKEGLNPSDRVLAPSQLGQPSPLELSVGRGMPLPMNNKNALSDIEGTPVQNNAFLKDPRFAMSATPEQRSRERDSFAPAQSVPPTSNQPIPIESLGDTRLPTEGNVSEALNSMMAARDPSKSDLQRPRTGTQGRKDVGSPTLLNPNVGSTPQGSGPAMDKASESWTAAIRDLAKKGPDLAKRDFTMPEVRDAELSVDRFKRPDTGGPQIARSAVPIPAPAFSQRLRRNREQAEDTSTGLGPLGPQTEAAIELGLQFLAKHQRDDGSWQLEDFGERVEMRSDTAATALALLSFQGAGYTHKQFKYADACQRAVDWLIKHQRPNGDLYLRTDAKSDANAWLYSHAIATLAVCETYGMTQDENIRDSAQRAIDFLVNSQDPQAGGWRYQPRIGSDTSVTGWCMMALKSAELSGLRVPQESYSGIAKWLTASQASEQQRYLYRYNWQAADTPATRHGRVPTPVMTSVGLLMRLYLGWRRTNPDMLQGTDWLLERLPSEGTVANPQRDTYYWYYATQVLFHMGSERWKKWYESLYPMLIRSQRQDGEFVGSWDPNGKIPDAWGRFGGRLYVTTLNLLSLEVYYRHLPIYEAAAD